MAGVDEVPFLTGLARREHDRARAELRWAEQEGARVRAEQQQWLIDAELRETRQALREVLRQRGGGDGLAFLDEGFLAVADRSTVVTAIMDAAVLVAKADYCDLQVVDQSSGSLRLEGQRGFSPEFVVFFSTVGRSEPGCSCAEALRAEHPVLVDDVTRSPIFLGQPSLDVLRAAGSRAVHSYPLPGRRGQIAGMISLHYRAPGPSRSRSQLVAAGAAQALAVSLAA